MVLDENELKGLIFYIELEYHVMKGQAFYSNHKKGPRLLLTDPSF